MALSSAVRGRSWEGEGQWDGELAEARIVEAFSEEPQ